MAKTQNIKSFLCRGLVGPHFVSFLASDGTTKGTDHGGIMPSLLETTTLRYSLQWIYNVAERQMVVHLEIVHCKNFIHRYIECSFCLPVSYETGSSETVDSKKFGSITRWRVLANEFRIFGSGL